MTNRSTARSIDEYIAEQPPQIQALLEEVRAAVRAAAPEAVETISYAIPTFDLCGTHVVHFAAFKRHIGFFPTEQGVAAFKDELSAYKTSRGTIQLPYGQPLPIDLVTRIVEARVEQIRFKGAAGEA